MAEGGGRQQGLSRAERAAEGRAGGSPAATTPRAALQCGQRRRSSEGSDPRAERGSGRDDLGTLPPAVLWREGTKAGSREVKCVQHKTEPVTELAVLGPGPG